MPMASAKVLNGFDQCALGRRSFSRESPKYFRTAFSGKSLGIQTSRTGSRLRLSKLPGSPRRLCLTIKASVFGVGAPEALLVGVVALVVFGPKGLAQAVKSLGATLRTFSPTIKELANVTNELSSTLQDQIGLNEIRNEFRNPTPTYRPFSQDVDEASIQNGSSGDTGSSTSQQIVKEVPDEDLEAKIAESKRLAWGDLPPVSEKVSGAAEGQGFARGAADLSLEELEAELKRRRTSTESKV